MNALLIRVAADLGVGGGSWNGPVDSQTGKFAYVAIPENSPVRPGLEKPYSALEATLDEFGVSLPAHLRLQNMHLDPDFGNLTYGDAGERAKQIRQSLGPGDLAVFYGGLRDIHGADELVYAIIGVFEVDFLMPAAEVVPTEWDINAHSRRLLEPGATDVIVRGRPGSSGRFESCLSIGEYRERAYRTRRTILEEWGGLSVKNGYLQRSARLPRFLDPPRFRRWLERQRPNLIQANN